MKIKTERLLIDQLTGVFPEHVEWLNDKKHMRFSEQRHRVHTAGTQVDYVCSQTDTLLLWNIHNNDNKTIGTLSAHIDERNNIADLGILIGPKFGGHGYGAEAYRAVSDWLLQENGTRKVEGGCSSNNTAMVAIFARAGFDPEGMRKEHFLMDTGTAYGYAPYDCLLFGKFFPSDGRGGRKARDEKP